MFGDFKEACLNGLWDKARTLSIGQPKWRAWASSKYGARNWATEQEAINELGSNFSAFSYAFERGDLDLALTLSVRGGDARRWAVRTFGLPFNADNPLEWLDSSEIASYEAAVKAVVKIPSAATTSPHRGRYFSE